MKKIFILFLLIGSIASYYIFINSTAPELSITTVPQKSAGVQLAYTLRLEAPPEIIDKPFLQSTLWEYRASKRSSAYQYFAPPYNVALPSNNFKESISFNLNNTTQGKPFSAIATAIYCHANSARDGCSPEKSIWYASAISNLKNEHSNAKLHLIFRKISSDPNKCRAGTFVSGKFKLNSEVKSPGQFLVAYRPHFTGPSPTTPPITGLLPPLFYLEIPINSAGGSFNISRNQLSTPTYTGAVSFYKIDCSKKDNNSTNKCPANNSIFSAAAVPLSTSDNTLAACGSDKISLTEEFLK